MNRPATPPTLAQVPGRQVRHLDREPGQPAEVATVVAGFRIEKGIPIPSSRNLRDNIAAAMAALEVGDSFLVPQASAKSSIYKAGELLRPKRFFARQTAQGFRIWRSE